MHEKLHWSQIAKTALADWRGSLAFIAFTIAILFA